VIAGFFGKTKPEGKLIKALGADFKKGDKANVIGIEGNGLWVCLVCDRRQQLDPPSRCDNVTCTASDPVFVGTLDDGYRWAAPDELATGLTTKGVTFFREVINNVCAAAVEISRKGSRLHLVSHRLGPGRMYYRATKGGIAFSSDASILSRVAPTRPDLMSLWSILIYGAVPEPLTVFDGVFAVPVGQAATFELGASTPTYTQILCLDFVDEPEIDEYVCLKQAKNALLAGAKVVAELGTSMTISGGIDSSLFLCLMQEATDRPKQGYMCQLGRPDPEVVFAQRAAEASNTTLRVFELSEDQVVSAIRHAAESAMHPFSDFSTIPVAFLLRRIAEERPDCPWVFDGNGGDDCFGVAGQEMLRKWQRITVLPSLFRRIASSLWLDLGIWKRHSLLDIGMRKIYQTCVDDAALAPFVFGHNGMTYAEPTWFQKVSELLLASCMACTGNRGNHSLYTRFYTIQLLHVCGHLWTAKALGPAHELGKSMLYPYLWRDVLTSMSRIPWQMKVRNGVTKWPLKRMLEDYMPPDFIHRKKVGYVPPWRKWLRGEEISSFVRETLLGGTRYITAVLREEWIERMLRHLKETDANPPAMVLNTIWGALATELWLQKNLA